MIVFFLKWNYVFIFNILCFVVKKGKFNRYYLFRKYNIYRNLVIILDVIVINVIFRIIKNIIDNIV